MTPPAPAEIRVGAVGADRTETGVAFGVMQTILADPELNKQGVYGNCFQAAVASLFGLPLDAVPHFMAFADWEAALDLWARGYDLTVRKQGTTAIPGERCLVSGISPRGVRHVVAVLGAGCVWDPHPSHAGLTTVDTVWYFDPEVSDA